MERNTFVCQIYRKYGDKPSDMTQAVIDGRIIPERPDDTILQVLI